jgi:hypothetical protein
MSSVELTSGIGSFITRITATRNQGLLLFQLKGKTPEPLTTANFNYTFRDKG